MRRTGGHDGVEWLATMAWRTRFPFGVFCGFVLDQSAVRHQYWLVVTRQVPERDLLIASFVRDRRKTAGLTQTDLADLAGVGKRFLVELEDGKPSLRMDKVNQVLRPFGKRLGPVDLPPESPLPPRTDI